MRLAGKGAGSVEGKPWEWAEPPVSVTCTCELNGPGVRPRETWFSGGAAY